MKARKNREKKLDNKNYEEIIKSRGIYDLLW